MCLHSVWSSFQETGWPGTFLISIVERVRQPKQSWIKWAKLEASHYLNSPYTTKLLVTKTVWYQYKNRHIDQWSKIGNPEANSHITHYTTRKDLKQKLKPTVRAKRETSAKRKKVVSRAFSLSFDSLCGEVAWICRHTATGDPSGFHRETHQWKRTVDIIDCNGWWVIPAQMSPRRRWLASSHLAEEPTEFRTQNTTAWLHLVAPHEG